MSVTIAAMTGKQIVSAIDDLARLRIAVFVEWPYLYDGDPVNEAGYLREFAAAPDGILVAVRDGGRIIGAATASPMAARITSIGPVAIARLTNSDESAGMSRCAIFSCNSPGKTTGARAKPKNRCNAGHEGSDAQRCPNLVNSAK